MTTNKPEVVAYLHEPATAQRYVSLTVDRHESGSPAPLIRLSDYEALHVDRDQQYDMKVKARGQRDAVTAKLKALQAERDLLRKHLQNLIDQTTPLEPVPGNPMWSRRIQLDEVIAERDQLRAECEKLRKAIRRLCNIYVVDDYWFGDLREEELSRAVERAIDAAMETTK